MFPIVLSLPPPTVGCGRPPAGTVEAQGRRAPRSYVWEFKRHVVLTVTRAVRRLIRQDFCKHTESSTQNGLMRLPGFGFYFSGIFCFRSRTIIIYIVLGSWSFAFLSWVSAQFCCHVSSFSWSVQSNSLLITGSACPAVQPTASLPCRQARIKKKTISQ